MKLSIVATLYRSELYIPEFYQRATLTGQRFAENDYEIILVNDGSPDRSFELAEQIALNDSHVTVVDLSRNFGHHKAMMTGLKQASGNYIFLLDCDLEESPEWLHPFYDQMRIENCDVVYGVQKARKGGFFERFTGEIFYTVFRSLTGLDLPSNIIVCRLMTRRYVQALVSHEECELFMAGLWLITGFKQSPQYVSKLSRGETTYTLGKKISQMVNSITSFSHTPLVWIFFVGISIFTLSGIYNIYLLINWLFLSRPPSGYTSLIGSVWLLGGMIMACIGIIGIYLSKIYLETKRRPYTIIRQIIKKPEDSK